MGIIAMLDKDLVIKACAYAEITSRSPIKQIEHWAKVGRIAEDNPDLCYEDIKGILDGMEEAKNGLVQTNPSGKCTHRVIGSDE